MNNWPHYKLMNTATPGVINLICCGLCSYMYCLNPVLVVVETGFWGDPEILVTVSNLQYSIQGGKTI